MKITSNETFIAGPCGNIQAIVDLPSEPNTQFFSVNCHPHSLHGGSMTNKVVHTLSRSIAGLGVPSIRFNFRGVGGSEGEYNEGQGEQNDLEAVVEWMQKKYPNAKLILSGFSFGSFVSAFAANKLKPNLLISVAPPIKRVSFAGFERPACRWQVIMGTKDELVDYAAVKSWVEAFEEPPELITMDGASHFFHGRLIELRQHVESIVSNLIKGF
jgi:alpha/beta superfamily hydrolase